MDFLHSVLEKDVRRIRVKWFGLEWEKEHSVIARLSFAVGLGFDNVAQSIQRYIDLAGNTEYLQTLAFNCRQQYLIHLYFFQLSLTYGNLAV